MDDTNDNADHDRDDVDDDDYSRSNGDQDKLDDDEMEIRDEIDQDKDRSPSPDDRKSEDSKDDDYDESYFKRMHSRSQDSFHDPTDKELFVDNLLNNIRGKEMKLCRYRHSSSCLAWLLDSNVDTNKLKKIVEAINPEEITMSFMSNSYCRTVLEAAFEELMINLRHEDNFESEISKWIIKWIDGVAKFLVDNLTNFLTEEMGAKGSRIVVLLLEAIGGFRIGRNWSRKNMRFASGNKIDLEAILTNDMAIKEIPQSFKHHLKKVAKLLIIDSSDEEIRDRMLKRFTNVTQYLLFILRVRYSELCQMVVKKLVEVIFENEENRDTICHDTHGAYISEILLLVASESRLSKIWTKHIKPEMKHYWKHEMSQFIVQRLLDAAQEDNLYADVAQALLADLRDIVKYQRHGIVINLAKNCKVHEQLQQPFVTAILKAFECYESKSKQLEIVPQILYYEKKYQKPHGLVWLYGSLILQHMFGYQDTYKISKSLAAMPSSELKRVCMDRSGSHVINAFLKSPTVELKHKSEFVEKLLGHYAILACDRFGSRTVENIMELSNDEVRAAILKELQHDEKSLMKSRNGWFIAKNFGLLHFKNRPNEWRDVERGRKRKREFDDFGGNDFNSRHRRDFTGGDRRDFRHRNGGGHGRRSVGDSGKRF